MSTTARDLIIGAMRLIGVTATGEIPSAPEIQDGVWALNGMLDSWGAENLMVPNKVRDTILMVPGQAQYTMGPDPTGSLNASLNSPRPIELVEALIQVAGTAPILEIAMEQISVKQYADIGIKTLQSTIPTKIYREGTYPLETFDLWPIPSVANTLVLYTRKPLLQVTDLNTVISLPEGYWRALRFNLACELAPEYGKQIPQETMAVAMEAKAIVKRKNIKSIYMDTESFGADQRRFNVYTGDY